MKLSKENLIWEPFDFIMSAFAIHHLELSQKKALFYRIIEALNSGAYFLNIDVALPANSQTEDWYYELWREWIDCHHKSLTLRTLLNMSRTRHVLNLKIIMIHYKFNFAILVILDFVDVECHYKYGLFTIYGAKKALTIAFT